MFYLGAIKEGKQITFRLDIGDKPKILVNVFDQEPSEKQIKVAVVKALKEFINFLENGW